MSNRIKLKPKDHGEAVAIFRAEIIGALTRRTLAHGELAFELEDLSKKRFRPPGRKTTRRYAVPTLQRWYYRYREHGIEGLRPKPRSDRGHAQSLNEKTRELLLDIRREHPNASAPLILRTLIADGRLRKDVVTEHAIRRLFIDHGLDRRTLQTQGQGRTRLPWQAERPWALCHGDVCYGASLLINGVKRPLRIHALLDDASRYVPAIEARHTEQEIDMIRLLIPVLRRFGPPGTLYLDNGSTYVGEILKVACARLGITLLHPRPYDPEARAKMERFWGTLRRGCLDFLGNVASLHDVNVRLYAFVDQHYNKAPHAGLLGRTPESVFNKRESFPLDDLCEAKLRDAFTVRETRRIHRDTTVSVRGQLFQLDEGFLAGARVTVVFCLLDEKLSPFVEHQGRTFILHPVDRIKNGKTKRPKNKTPLAKNHVSFDPTGALLDRAVGRFHQAEDK